MKLFNAFKSPAWEQRDPERRAQAVRDGSEAELVAKLSEIAAQDPEPAVRRAALARLAVPAQLLERWRTEGDGATREVAAARLAKLLLDPAAGLAPGARLAAVGLDLPAELLERVAESAPEPAARRAALARVTRPAYLARRCADEPDATLRAELLERIEGEEALDKLAEALRKRDKTLARRARERAEASRLARGEPGALARHADALCETLTTWARELPEDIEARLEGARQAWTVQRERFDAAPQARVDAYFLRVREALERRTQRAGEAAPAPAPDAGPEAVAPIVMQGETAYSEQVAPATTPARAAVDWSALDQALADANRAAAAKHLGEARPALAQVQQLLPTLPKLDRARREKLVEIEARIDELDQWQRWSGNRVRARLCEEMEALIAAAPHPDAVANKVKELQQEWAKVEAAEPGDADRTSGLARRFRALCGRAMAPTRPYFEQRHALREQRRAALEAKLAEATPEALAGLAAPAAIGLRRRLVEALRTLDELEPKARTALARQLREALTRIDATLDAQREDAALARRKLIAKLRRELTHAAPAEALALARDAQLQWKGLPRAAREQEATLEQELQALIDPLFARERDQRNQLSEQAGRIDAESRRVLAELAALAQGDAEALAHAEGKLAALAACWKELHAVADAAPEERRARREPGREARGGRAPHGDRGGRDERSAPPRRGAREGDGRRDGGRDPAQRDRERAFDQAVAGVRQAQARLETTRRGARLQALLDAAHLLEVRAGGTCDVAVARAQWDGLPLDAGDRARLMPRWQAAVDANGGEALDAGATPAAAARALQAETWLVEAELDASLDSPAAAQSLRRERQMQRLAQRLQGASAPPPPPHERLHGWIALGPLAPDAVRAARLARLLEAWSAASR